MCRAVPQLFGITSTPTPGVDGHVFRNPVDPGTFGPSAASRFVCFCSLRRLTGWARASVAVESFMVMLCYKNGSLTREAVRDRVCGGTWDGMADLVSKSTPGNSGYVGFFVTQVRTWLGLYGRRACRDDDNGMCGCVPSPRSLHTSQPPARTCSLRQVNL